MPTDPLFVVDFDALAGKLRLSGVDSASPTLELIYEALLVSRTGFIRRLGSARISQILAIPHTDNPVSENDIIRSTAETAEVKWVKLELIRTLPYMALDSSGRSQQNWNEEGLWRGFGEKDRAKELARLEEDLEDLLSDLEGDDATGGKVIASSIDPDPLPPPLGYSVLGPGAY